MCATCAIQPLEWLICKIGHTEHQKRHRRQGPAPQEYKRGDTTVSTQHSFFSSKHIDIGGSWLVLKWSVYANADIVHLRNCAQWQSFLLLCRRHRILNIIVVMDKPRNSSGNLWQSSCVLYPLINRQWLLSLCQAIPIFFVACKIPLLSSPTSITFTMCCHWKLWNPLRLTSPKWNTQNIKKNSSQVVFWRWCNTRWRVSDGQKKKTPHHMPFPRCHHRKILKFNKWRAGVSQIVQNLVFYMKTDTIWRNK